VVAIQLVAERRITYLMVGAHMADYAVPRFVRVVDAIAPNRTGKVDKAGLRRALLAELGSGSDHGAS